MKHHITLFIALIGFTRLLAADSMNMSGDMKQEILTTYVKVSTALAADDLASAKAAAAIVAEHAGMSDSYKTIAAKAQALAKSSKIYDARGDFRDLSAAIEPLAVGENNLVIMHCPMADSDWVQAKGKTKNPYFGKAMLTCGSPKKMK